MATITEDYVSFETAKLLKEKGFDEPCWSWYHNGNHTHTGTSRYYNSELEKYDFSKATLAHVMKWFREVYKIFIEPSVSRDLNGNYHYSYSILNEECFYVRKGYTNFDWDYKQACEAAVLYCLEHLI